MGKGVWHTPLFRIAPNFRAYAIRPYGASTIFLISTAMPCGLIRSWFLKCKSGFAETLWPFLVLDKTENLYPFSGNPENNGIAFEYKVADVFVLKINRLPETEWSVGYGLYFAK